MAQTLPSTFIPSKDSSKSVEHRVLSLQFGNGYQQDVVDGINNKYEMWNVSFQLLTLADKNSIVAILNAAGAWDVINWTAPGGTALKYKMDKSGYTETNLGADRFNLTFKLKQVY